MFAAILVGGKGTRMRSHSSTPKPLIKINRKEILKWIIDIYLKEGVKKFYLLCRTDNKKLFFKFKKKYKNININVIDTGLNSSILQRISFIKKFIGKNKFFFLTYGDSVANFNRKKSLGKLANKKVVVTLYKKKKTYGLIEINKNKIIRYSKNNSCDIVNAGFYTIKSEILNLLKNSKDFEKLIFNILRKSNDIGYIYSKIWFPIDNKKDLILAKEYFK